jgi:hypothetical protein
VSRDPRPGPAQALDRRLEQRAPVARAQRGLVPSQAARAAAGYGGSRVIDMLVGDPLPRIC